jgi:hypothetical protein
MAFNIWTQTSGTSLGILPEQVTVNIPLPIVPSAAFNGVPPPSFDGTNHHPTAPLRNSAGAPFVRNAVNSYVDGIHQIRSDLPNARTVSNLIVWDQVNGGNTPDPTGYSGFMYAWGQFLTHELAAERTGGANIDVIVPVGDTNLTPGSHIPVTRARVAPETGTNGIVATFINDVTGWIDGSVIYGIAYPPGVVPASGFANPISLREGGSTATTGKLLTSSNGQYPAIVNNNFLLGDPRGTENPDLTSIQTLMVREHNWHATRLAQLHPDWTGEQIYQRARSIVIAEEQVITYNEWLPKVVGATAIPAYTGFKPDTDASIKIEFAAAALRFGHSIVSGAQDRVDEFGNITESVTLGQAFFLTPTQYERNGGANGFLRKLASDISNKLDVYIIEDLRNLLNDPPAALDLAATNIQRGRDLGLPSLNQMRTALGLPLYTAFNQITTDATVAHALEVAYIDINKIDLWVGGLAEDRVLGAMVGSTFQAILVDQFVRTRDGDNQWFENQPWATSDLEWLRATTLSDIILRNTDTVRMQADAFVAVERADLYNGTVQTIIARTTGFPYTDNSPATFTIISGKLPTGLFLINHSIVGTPEIVDKDTLYTFCIRASDTNGNIADRTFTATITGLNLPSFVTPAGLLPVGLHKQLYALDQTYVDYTLEGFDLNTFIGAKLHYSILSGDGELPPGLSLDPNGTISGFILPATKITPADGSGTYDESIFDAVAYDFAPAVPSNGFDDFQYDDAFYDFNIPDATPTTLSRNYQFKVTVTDGQNYSQRIFRIFVIGDDSFKADSTELDGAVGGLFTADVTYIREPSWLTNGNLGIHRANNYITVPIALYNRDNVLFRVEKTNKEISAVAKHIAGTDNLLTSQYISIINASAVPVVGQWLSFDNYFTGATEQAYRITNVQYISTDSFRLTVNSAITVAIPDDTVFYIGSLSTLPVGTKFDVNSADIYGVIPYQPAVTTVYTFTITATRVGNHSETLSSSKTFTITIVGEIDSVISWITPNDLGSVDANYVSTLKVEASTTITDAVIFYTLVDGKLPNGLSLNGDGEIIGKPNQFNTDSPGIISFDVAWNATHHLLKPTTFDNKHTTFDKVYTFAVKAQDQYGYSASTRIFTLRIDTPNIFLYSNIRVKPYLKINQRSIWHDLINNSTVFTPSAIYRPNDSVFGVQSDLTMLIYAGIQTEAAGAYVGAMGLNHKRKRFQFGTLSSAVAVDRVSNTQVYEVVYLNMIDPAEFKGQHLPHKIAGRGLDPAKLTVDASNNFYSNAAGDLSNNIPLQQRTDFQITIDSTGYQASNFEVKEYFPNSITNWQNNLSGVGATERNYLPLWMRTIQPGSKQELGFQLAVPICYCKVGSAAGIILNIKNYIKTTGFSFNNLDYTVDRYIIDSVTGLTSDKYLVFRNDRITV